MLEIAGFQPKYEYEGYREVWTRKFPPQVVQTTYGSRDYAVEIERSIEITERGTNELHFLIKPSIGEHTFEDHRRSGLLAAVIFQLGQVIVGISPGADFAQYALMGECNVDVQPRLLAHNPDQMPMMQEHLCKGFQAVMEGEIALEYEID